MTQKLGNNMTQLALVFEEGLLFHLTILRNKMELHTGMHLILL